MKAIHLAWIGAVVCLAPVLGYAAPIGGPAKAGDFGVGAQLGVPFGISAKYWMDNRLAFQSAIGTWSSDFTATADIVWHDMTALRSSSNSEAPGFYLGGGLYISEDNEDELGIRALVGLNYFFPSNPFEVYVELAPTLILEEDSEGDLTGGVGMRYYFR